MYKIKAKYAPEVLCPTGAIEAGFWSQTKDSVIVTADGKTCKAKPIAVWNNKEGIWDEELDELCREKWNIPFLALRSVWIGRLDTIDEFWHLIELEEI